MAVRPAIHEVRSGDGIVFLDLYEDEYSCRYEPATPIGDYHYRCFAKTASGQAGLPPVPASSWNDISMPAAPSPSIRDITRFVWALTRSAIRFHRHPLLDLVRTARSLGTRPRDTTLDTGQVAKLFQQLLILTPLKPHCLFNSFFLLHFLGAYGYRADWIFGVQLFPFRAHCWLAIDDMLLGEAAHRIEGYQIIWTARRSDP